MIEDIVNHQVLKRGYSDEFEIEYIKKDGTVFPISTRGWLINDEQGNPVGIWAIIRDITERKRAEEQLRTALAEKEILLRELYHRTKNNMQVICSIFALQTEHVEDEYALSIFKEMEDRIQSMALVHQKLYQSRNLSNIDLKGYISDLAALLMQSYKIQPNRISLILDTDRVFASIDTAIPCGLILNELIVNSFKHAFPGDMKGEIRIQLSRTEDGTVVLQVSDNGIGIPRGFDFRQDGKLGLQTVLALGEHQLQGEVIFESGDGVACQVRFQDQD